MKIRLHIPDENKFWLECTSEEAESFVYPYLDKQKIAKSKKTLDENIELKSILINCNVECFLVSKDLLEIVPFPANYPFHNMWNAYSPFRKINEININNINDIKDIKAVELLEEAF